MPIAISLTHVELVAVTPLVAAFTLAMARADRATRGAKSLLQCAALELPIVGVHEAPSSLSASSKSAPRVTRTTVDGWWARR